MPSARPVPRALERGLEILAMVACAPAGIRYSQIVDRMELPNTTVTRLLRSLIHLSFLAREESGCYVSGPAMSALGSRPDVEQRLMHVARQPLRQLAGRAKNSTALLVWTGQYAVFLDRCLHEGSLVFQAPGYVIQAIENTPWGVFFLTDRQWRDLLAKPGIEAGDRRDWLAAERARLADQGFCCGHTRNRYRLAAPLRDETGRIVGALALGGTPSSLDAATVRRFSPLLVDLARACSQRLGWSPSGAAGD